MKKIAVLIPCYNESQTIAKVVADYRAALPEADIYVYDNNSKDGTDEIRTPLMSSYASGVSAQACVRDFLLDMQRELARRHNVVMDGRDIATVVLPNADVKIFLTASPEIRAKRRFAELQAKGEKTTLEKVLSDMKARDKQDSTRTVAPLRCAPDAVKLDTSEMNLEEAKNAILELVRRKLG